LEAVIGPERGQVCQDSIAPEKCKPGSPHRHAACAQARSSSRAEIVSITSPVVTACSGHAPSSAAACMNSSLTQTACVAF